MSYAKHVLKNDENNTVVTTANSTQ